MVCKSCCKEEKRKKYKRGLWSPEEDCKLRNYILKYGHGYWSEVPKLAGLQRSGKSCRLRWINYLRPGLKRGAFSQQEQMIIINAHAFLGNRWSQIASMLPRRTDNEIKNFWHTHLKKQLNICGIDTNAHNTPGGCTRKETCTKMDFVSDGEINFQSTSSEFPLKLTTPFHTDCSTRQAEFWFEDVKPNPVSKCLQKAGSFLDVLFPERLHSEGSENCAINMGSDKLLMPSQSAVGSENSSCISDQSGLLTMLEEYPLPNETNHIIASAESNPGINMPTLSSDGSDSGFPCERILPILSNDFSTTSADITSMNMSEYWHNMSYNEVDLGMHQSTSLIQNCCLFDVDFG